MSLTFKDMVKADIGATFFNNNEFSDYHTIDGKQMHVTIDENELLEREQAYIVTQRTEGIYKKRLLIFVPAEEYGPQPRIGGVLNLDGKRIYTITDCSDEDGVYSISLEANRA